MSKSVYVSTPYLWDSSAFLPAQFIRLVDQHVRAHGDVLRVRSTVREPEDGIALLETLLAVAGQLFNRPAELDAHGLGCLRRNGIQTLALEEVHSIQAERFDLDEGLRVIDLRSGNLVDEQVLHRAFAAFDVCARSMPVSRRKVILVRPTYRFHGRHCQSLSECSAT